MGSTENIQDLLEEIERRRGISILYACESGSRAWGFASPDSDYDIRFIYSRPFRDYLSCVDGTESVDLPLQGELDAGGWDLRKAVRLLGKSNAALVEWLHSPVVYRETPGFRDRWQAMAREVFSPTTAFHHYRGLAVQMWKKKLQQDQVRAKDYLYALRASLCARWLLDGKGIPPVAFSELVSTAPGPVLDLIPALLDHKSKTGEGELMPRLPALDDFLEGVAASETGEKSEATDVDRLSRFFHQEMRVRRPVLRARDFTIERVRQPDLLLLDTVAGSHAYGTAVEGSDEDRRGVFVTPADFLGGLEIMEQVSDERSDQVYYELGRWVSLLLKNNPNAMELLAMPDDCVRHRHPLLEKLTPDLFLSKLCARTFGEYAMGQIRKARGLHKKIVNPQPEQRRALLEFCHVPEDQGSVPLLAWLAARGLDAGQCGLTAIPHAPGWCAIYHDAAHPYRGLVSPKDRDVLVFSSVPKEAVPVTHMVFNEDAFRAHCKAHREYWEWVGLRNEERYLTNAGHGRGYDSKNMMHTFRLLHMAAEILEEGVLRVRRPERDWLLRVRAGEFAYEELVEQAEEKLEAVRQAAEHSRLPDEPDAEPVRRVLIEIREEFPWW